MSKFSRWLFLILALFLLVMLPTKTAFAMDENADSVDGSEASKDQIQGHDGINENRMGYIIWLSDGSGRSLNGKVHLITTDGKAPYVPSGRGVQNELHTRFGEMATTIIGGTPVWGVGPISEGNISNEPILTAFITQPYQDVDSGGDWVCVNYLGYTPEQLSQIIDTNSEVFLNFMPFIVAGIYGSTEDSHSGEVIAGTTIGWARRSEPNNYLGRYTNAAINNSHHYEESWMGLSVPTNVGKNVKHSNAEILSNIGLGIVSYTVKAGDKDIIKTYYDAGTLTKTSYGTTTSPVNIKDEGSYIVKEWFTSKTRTKLSGNQEYPRFESELAPKVQSGSGTSTVTMPEIEKTIVIRLEREEMPTPATSSYDVIYSHELNIVSPFLADYHRLDNPASINNLVKFKLTESEAETIVKDGYSGSGTISNIEIKDDSFVLKHKVSGDSI